MRLLALFLASASLLIPATPKIDFPSDLSAELESVIARYADAIPRQRAAMLGQQMEMDIDGRLTNLKEEGRLKLLRTIKRLGEITYDVVDFQGNDRVKKELIFRYLDEEQKARAYGAVALTPADYEFKIRAVLTTDAGTKDSRKTYVFSVKPRHKASGLFRGELWIDGATGMPLKEAGQLVQSPSFWLSQIRFQRDYELIDGIAVVKHFESSAYVRLLGVGRAELNIDFSDFKPAAPEVAERAVGL